MAGGCHHAEHPINVGIAKTPVAAGCSLTYHRGAARWVKHRRRRPRHETAKKARLLMCSFDSCAEGWSCRGVEVTCSRLYVF